MHRDPTFGACRELLALLSAPCGPSSRCARNVDAAKLIPGTTASASSCETADAAAKNRVCPLTLASSPAKPGGGNAFELRLDAA